jgi:hypothetical protein
MGDVIGMQWSKGAGQLGRDLIIQGILLVHINGTEIGQSGWGRKELENPLLR